MVIDELQDAYDHQVIGLSISWHTPDPNDGPAEDPSWAGMRVGGTFHADIGTTLRVRPGVQRYRVHGRIGPHRSETLTIEIDGGEDTTAVAPEGATASEPHRKKRKKKKH
jgi:hypothetical protein